MRQRVYEKLGGQRGHRHLLKMVDIAQCVLEKKQKREKRKVSDAHKIEET